MNNPVPIDSDSSTTLFIGSLFFKVIINGVYKNDDVESKPKKYKKVKSAPNILLNIYHFGIIYWGILYIYLNCRPLSMA